MVVAAGSGSVVEVGGPGVGQSGFGGEGGDGVAQLLVAGPADPDGPESAGLPGGGGCADQAGQRCGRGEAGSAVADLGQEPGCPEAAGPGQAGEDVGVGVVIELPVDQGGERFDLFAQSRQHRDQRCGYARLAGAGGAGGAAAGASGSRWRSTAGSVLSE